MTTREALHRLIDELPEAAVPAVERYATSLRDDPVLLALETAPTDDEPTSPDEDARADAAWVRYQRGEFVTDEELARRIGE